MMFYALGATLCLAVLFIVMAGTFMFCLAAPWIARPWLRSAGPGAAANLFFFMLALPLLLAGGVTLGFALPAFLKFEPHSTGEALGLKLLAPAGAGALVVFWMAVRAARVILATMLAEKQWRACSTEMSAGAGLPRIGMQRRAIPLYRVEGDSSLLAVTGIFRPKIFVARAVLRTLSPDELAAALAHEMAHVHALDNLKQFLLKIVRAPRWLNLFWSNAACWMNASEMAADEAALAQGTPALDLSSALIKIGRLNRPAMAGGDLAVSHLLPDAGSSLELRVARLRKLLEEEPRPGAAKPDRNRARFFIPFLLLVLAYAACINAILPTIHEALELLVR